MTQSTAWPKQRPELTRRQKEILEDWYGYWLTLFPNRFSGIARFNHSYAIRTATLRGRTLEIGAGEGEHMRYESLDTQEYFALELREALANRLHTRFPQAKVIVGDCEDRIDVPEQFFDRIIAIHVLEHLTNLPKALDELVRVLAPGGRLSVVIPCEGGLLYSLGRKLSSKRIFEKRYGVDYDWMISYEHVNRADEIVDEILARFVIEHSTYYPFKIPSVNANTVIGLTLRPAPRRGTSLS
jgi:SAM-dependent methyltransferase